MTPESWTIVLVVVATLIAWRRWRHGEQRASLLTDAAERMSEQAADEFILSVARQSFGKWILLVLLAFGGGVFAPNALDLVVRMVGSDDAVRSVPMLHYYDAEEELRYEVEQSEQCVLDGGPCHVTVCKEEGSCWEFDIRWRPQ